MFACQRIDNKLLELTDLTISPVKNNLNSNSDLEKKGQSPETSTPSRQPTGHCEKADLTGSGPLEEPDIKGSDTSPFGSNVLLFVTNPHSVIRLNPSLFPSEGGAWSTTSLMPPDGRNRLEKKDIDLLDRPPLPVLPTVPAGCTETLLGIDFTPEEYLEQTIADHYYAQGIKLVDGVRRVVFYHRHNF